MKFLLSGLLSILFLVGFSQQSRQDILIPGKRIIHSSLLKSLEARFTADLTQGVAPLTVQFTDQSTGNPTTWKWTFGDGDSSTVQNPTHVYQAPGVYSVKLTVSDITSSFALEKQDYIRATQNYVNCDTLRYPLPEPLTYYIITDKGYVTGNNSYGDKAISDYFENVQPNLVITGMVCEFSKAKQAAGNNEKIHVKVWKHNSTTGKPGILLTSDSILLSDLVNDVTASRLTTIDFNNQVQPGGSFYVGIMLPALNGDTLCLWSTSTGKLPVNTTWILQSNDEWETAQVLWSNPGQNDFIISAAIYPKVCLLNGIDKKEIPVSFAIWPNPANESITLVNQEGFKINTEYHILEISGKELLTGRITSSLTTTIDVSMLKPGIYLVQIRGEKTTFTSKLIIR